MTNDEYLADRQRADAQLIAAAPDLLAACKAVCEGVELGPALAQIVCDAIAKAESGGGQ